MRGQKVGGHLNRMEETKTVRKFTGRNPIGMRSKGRPKTDEGMRC